LAFVYPAWPEKFDGGFPGSFLELGSGARALGMGRAYTAVAEGPGSILWKPAGLGQPARTELSLSHVTLFEGARLSELSAAHAFARPFGLGLSVVQFDMTGAEKRDVLNNRGGSIADSRTAYLAGIGYQPWERVTFGTTQKLLQRKVDDQSATAWDMDLGALYNVGRVRVGLEARNVMGSGLKRDGGTDRLSRAYRLGGAATFLGSLLASADVVSRQGVGTEINGGVEYGFAGHAALRAGWDGAAPTLGGSLSWVTRGYAPALDYALVRHEALGISHRMSLRLAFGPSLGQKLTARADWRTGKETVVAHPPPSPPAVPPDTTPPILKVSAPEQVPFEQEKAEVKIFTADEGSGIQDLRVEVNGKPWPGGAPGAPPAGQGQVELSRMLMVPLRHGVNEVRVVSSNRVGLTSEQAVRTVRAATAGTLYFLGVGVNRYPRLPAAYQLRYAVADAEALETVFEKQRGVLFSEVRTRLLKDAEVTRENVILARNDFLSDAKAHDTVVIYMSGHGIRDTRGVYYFLTANSDMEHPNVSGLSYGDIQDQLLAGYPTKSVLLMLDSCHSGAVAKAGADPYQEIKGLLESISRGAGAIVIGAATAPAYAAESKTWGHGALAYSVILGLEKGEANANADAVVSVSELFNYVSSKVPELTKKMQFPTGPNPDKIGLNNFKLFVTERAE